MRSFLLFFSTIVLAFAGILFAYVLLDDALPGSCKGQICGCNNGCVCVQDRLVCMDSGDNATTTDESLAVIPISNFVKKGLNFKASYVGNAVPYDIEASPAKVKVESSSLDKKNVEIVLLNKQKCDINTKIIPQTGLYYFSQDTLVLTNQFTSTTTDEFQIDCVVKLSYSISTESLKLPATGSSIAYQNTEKYVKFNICQYNGSLYNENDIFIAEDKCNTCTCQSGESICSTDKVCKSDGTSESAYSNYINYSRYEFPEESNECSGDEQCYIGGCSGEVCSAQTGINTTCEEITKLPGLSCKCAGKRCLWVR